MRKVHRFEATPKVAAAEVMCNRSLCYVLQSLCVASITRAHRIRAEAPQFPGAASEGETEQAHRQAGEVLPTQRLARSVARRPQPIHRGARCLAGSGSAGNIPIAACILHAHDMVAGRACGTRIRDEDRWTKDDLHFLAKTFSVPATSYRQGATRMRTMDGLCDDLRSVRTSIKAAPGSTLSTRRPQSTTIIHPGSEGVKGVQGPQAARGLQGPVSPQAPRGLNSDISGRFATLQASVDGLTTAIHK